MERKFPHLSEPITIGRVRFRNRMFSAPMGGTDIENDGCIGPKSTAFYELRSKGGGVVAKAHKERVRTIEVSSKWELFDVDTPDDLRILQEHLASEIE